MRFYCRIIHISVNIPSLSKMVTMETLLVPSVVLVVLVSIFRQKLTNSVDSSMRSSMTWTYAHIRAVSL